MVENANAALIRKTLVTKSAMATAHKAMEATGGQAFFRAAGLERLVRDVHAGQFHPLPEKKQQMFTGRLALGLPPIEVTPQPTAQQDSRGPKTDNGSSVEARPS